MPTEWYDRRLWREIRKLGRGDQGDASLVQHKRTGQLAVRKDMIRYVLLNETPLEAVILQEILPSSRQIVSMVKYTFDREARHSAGLVQWFEYCEGGDLQQAVGKRESIPEDFIWHCFIQIAHALDVIHNCGSRMVVHRDIKPDNIFLDQKYRDKAPWPNLRVGDFGMAVLEEHTEGIHVPCWQGPELPQLSPAGDIWSLGAIIHWLAHGRPPIEPVPDRYKNSPEKWERSPKAKKIMALPLSYSAKLNNYMMDCLEWDPKKRIRSKVLVDRLQRDRPRKRHR